MMKYEDVKLYDQDVKVSEVYFRFLLSGEDDMSKNFRHFIIQKLYGVIVKDTTVLSKGVVPKIYEPYQPLPDVLMKDEKKNVYQMELYTDSSSYEELDNINAYSLYLLRKMMTSVVSHSCFQIIFVNSLSFQMKEFITRDCVMDKGVVGGVVYRTFITLPLLMDIVIKKGIEGLSEVEKVCYILANGFCKEASDMESEMVHIMFEKQEEMMDECEWWEWNRAVERTKQRLHSKSCADRRRGKIALFEELIQYKYQVHAHEWLITLNDSELQKLVVCLCECADYHELQLNTHRV